MINAKVIVSINEIDWIFRSDHVTLAFTVAERYCKNSLLTNESSHKARNCEYCNVQFCVSSHKMFSYIDSSSLGTESDSAFLRHKCAVRNPHYFARNFAREYRFPRDLTCIDLLTFSRS